MGHGGIIRPGKETEIGGGNGNADILTYREVISRHIRRHTIARGFHIYNIANIGRRLCRNRIETEQLDIGYATEFLIGTILLNHISTHTGMRLRILKWQREVKLGLHERL